MERLLVTVAEAREMTTLGKNKAYELCASGEWPTVRVGRKICIDLAGLLRWKEQQAKREAE